MLYKMKVGGLHVIFNMLHQGLHPVFVESTSIILHCHTTDITHVMYSRYSKCRNNCIYRYTTPMKAIPMCVAVDAREISSCMDFVCTMH